MGWSDNENRIDKLARMHA